MVVGSPATPDHSGRRKLAYALIGLFLTLTAGLQNGLLSATSAQLRGDLSLDVVEGAWVQVAYFLSYATIGALWFKIRAHFSLQKFIRWVLLAVLVANILQVFVRTYEVELIARFVMGLGTSGLLTLGIFYVMQALSGFLRLIGIALLSGLMQTVATVCLMITPVIFGDGDMQAVFVLQFACVLIGLGLVMALPLPISRVEKSLTYQDYISFVLYALGIALLCAFLTLGNIVWWDTDWLGYFLAGGVGLVGLTLWIESMRAKPLIYWQWVSTRQIVVFMAFAALTRLFTTEQTVGAGGVLGLMGYGNEQLLAYYGIILAASLVGLLASVATLKIDDIRRSTLIAVGLIALASYLDIGVSTVTPVSHFYISQGLMAFATFYFAGPVLLEGLFRAIGAGFDHLVSFVAVFSATQTLGGLVGTAFFNRYFTVQTTQRLNHITEQITSSLSASEQMASLQKAPLEARILAYNDLFELIFVGAVICFGVMFLVWLYRRIYKIDVLADDMAKLKKMMGA